MGGEDMNFEELKGELIKRSKDRKVDKRNHYDALDTPEERHGFDKGMEWTLLKLLQLDMLKINK